MQVYSLVILCEFFGIDRSVPKPMSIWDTSFKSEDPTFKLTFFTFEKLDAASFMMDFFTTRFMQLAMILRRYPCKKTNKGFSDWKSRKKGSKSQETVSKKFNFARKKRIMNRHMHHFERGHCWFRRNFIAVFYDVGPNGEATFTDIHVFSPANSTEKLRKISGFSD